MIRRLLRRESGTAAIELGLLAPVLIFLLIGLVDIGRYVYYGLLATHAAVAGAQYGAQNLFTASSNASMQTAALNDAPALANAKAAAVHVCMLGMSTVACGASGATYFVQVQVSGTFHALISYPGIPASIPITSTAFMRVANQ